MIDWRDKYGLTATKTPAVIPTPTNQAVTKPTQVLDWRDKYGLNKQKEVIPPQDKQKSLLQIADEWGQKFLNTTGDILTLPFQAVINTPRVLNATGTAISNVAQGKPANFRETYKIAPTLAESLSSVLQNPAINKGVREDPTNPSSYFGSEFFANLVQVGVAATALGTLGSEIATKSGTVKITPEQLSGKEVMPEAHINILNKIFKDAPSNVIEQVRNNGVEIKVTTGRGGASQLIGENLLGGTSNKELSVKIPNYKPSTSTKVAPLQLNTNKPVTSNTGTIPKIEAPAAPKTAPTEAIAPKAGEYPTIHQGGKIRMVQGEPVKIIDGVDTILHQDENGRWVVSETTTGRDLSGGGFENSTFAIKAAKANIENAGIDNVKKAISENQLPKSTTPKPQSPLLQEAKKYKSAEEFVASQFNKKPEYGMSHRPSWEGMPPAYNLLEGETLPRDVYKNPDFSISSGRVRSGDKAANESWNALQKIKDKPDAEITVYRAGRENKLNTGDWVSFSKDYAKQSLEGDIEKVYSFKVKAKDVIFAGDDINEFGYYPKSQLTDIWKKANKATETPIDEKPIEGNKTSGIAKSINAKAIEQGLISKGFENLADFNGTTFSEQAELVSKLEPEQAKAIIRGEQPLPTNIRSAALISAMEDMAKQTKDVQLMYELANSPLATKISESASEVSLARMREKDSATIQLQEIKKAREARVKKQTLPQKQKVAKSVKTETEKTNLSPDELNWDKFLSEIQC